MIKLWLCLNVFRPQLVVNYWVHEKKLEDLTLLGCNNNVNTYLTTMEKMRTVINSMLPYKQEFAEHRFVTIMFDWIKKPKNFD